MKNSPDHKAGTLHQPTAEDQTLALNGGPAAPIPPISVDLLAATVPGIVFRRIRDRDGRLSYPYISPAVKRYVGYDVSEVKVALDGSLDFIHWADRDSYLRRVHDSARTGTPCPEEFRAIDRNGEVRWLLGSSLPRSLPDGCIVWDGTLIDVTDRKRAENWLGMIMDHAADVILTMTEDGLIEQTNAASKEVFGCHPDDLTGRPASVLMPQLESGDLVDLLRRYLITGESTLIGAGPREMEGRHANGSLFPIEVLVSEVLTEGRRLFIGVIRDISQRKAAETALMESQRRLTTIAENLQGLVFQRVLDTSGTLRFSYISGATLGVIGQSAAAVIQDANLLLQAMPADHRTAFLDALTHSARTLSLMEDDYTLIGQDGTECWLRGSSRPHRLDDGSVIWEGVALDVTERKQAESRLMFLAYHDPMTGLGNRSLLLERFKALTQDSPAPAARHDRIGLLSIGLERFSVINATVGHSMGDRVLTAVSQRLRAFLGPSDSLYRPGGGRFLAMLPDCGTEGDLAALLEQMVALFQSPVVVEEHVHDLSINIGVSLYPQHGTDAESLIMHADAALHEAKRNGSGLYRLFTPELGQQATKVVTLRHQMRAALEKREFRAFFQPQLDLATSRVVGTEALARWIADDGTLVPPGDFIPVAEEYGLIDDICVQVLEDACRWTARWNAMGLGPISVAVNISGRQFHTPAVLTEIVDRSLTTLGLPPEALELELTESTAMSDPENASKVMRMFTERGIGCSIDDFGTGYSSLSLLKRFSLRKLKIDRSFVNDVTTNPNDGAICSAIIAMSHAMGLKVCAEGVETPGQFQFLRDHGCDQVQGYLIARPLPPEDLEQFLSSGVEDIVARLGAAEP